MRRPTFTSYILPEMAENTDVRINKKGVFSMKKVFLYMHRFLLFTAIAALALLIVLGIWRDVQAGRGGEEFQPQKGQFVMRIQDQEVQYAANTDNLCEG